MLAPYVLPQLLARNLLGLLQNKIIFFVFFEFYSKIALFTHAISLDQTFVHCPKFPTAANCMNHISISLSQYVFSNLLKIID